MNVHSLSTYRPNSWLAPPQEHQTVCPHLLDRRPVDSGPGGISKLHSDDTCVDPPRHNDDTGPTACPTRLGIATTRLAERTSGPWRESRKSQLRRRPVLLASLSSSLSHAESTATQFSWLTMLMTLWKRRCSICSAGQVPQASPPCARWPGIASEKRTLPSCVLSSASGGARSMAMWKNMASNSAKTPVTPSS